MDVSSLKKQQCAKTFQSFIGSCSSEGENITSIIWCPFNEKEVLLPRDLNFSIHSETMGGILP